MPFGAGLAGAAVYVHFLVANPAGNLPQGNLPQGNLTQTEAQEPVRPVHQTSWRLPAAGVEANSFTEAAGVYCTVDAGY